jgi:membrane-associated phospholipid phosphatase
MTSISLLAASISLVSLAGFAGVARAVARRDTVDADWSVRNGVQAGRGPVGEQAASAAGPLGKEWMHLPAAAALGLYLWRTGSAARVAALPPLASLVAEATDRVLERTLRYREPPPKRQPRDKPSFPSSHALETAAVSLTSAWVLAEEGHAGRRAALATAALLSAASALGRVYLDRHWISDAAGGLLLGVSVAAACVAVCEVQPHPREP